MSPEAEIQIGKALRSLPWYLFLVPGLLLLLFLIMQPTELSQDYIWTAVWVFTRVGLFVWVLRQLLRYAMYKHLPRISLDQVLSFSAPVNAQPVSPHHSSVRRGNPSNGRHPGPQTVEAVFIRSGRLGHTR
jgi:hypothetical protein